MTQADIVIGANLGDEGKGLITDYYAARNGEKTIVVRHNSGPQAGHTVTLKDGRRHVFGHIGAGSFAGADTFLSRHFVSNPLLFRKEYTTLEKKCSIPSIYVDTGGLITTPYDMIINQIIEEHRSNKRHGSCGIGFGETIERNLNPSFTLVVDDLYNIKVLIEKLMVIRSHWLPKRLLALGLTKVPEQWIERIESKELLADYIDATGFFLRTIKKCKGLPLHSHTHVVCEGAQGLLLDQDHEWFPHVTRSYTGIRNALDILYEAGITDTNVTYVTRSYLTRHGAGPLPHETNNKPYTNIIDATNITNPFQGPLRFALLDMDRVSRAIHRDLSIVPYNMHVNAGLAVTCVDQIDDQAFYIKNGIFKKTSTEVFLDDLFTTASFVFGLTSHGPTRKTFRTHTFNTGGIDEQKPRSIRQ